MTTYFVSDLHLDASRPAATGCFKQFLVNEVRGSDALYILGDLFEGWAGDDDVSLHDGDVLDAISQLKSSGTDCFFLAGNRDFLLGKDALDRAGMANLDDEEITTIEGHRVLLMHGDTLCTDDASYQKYRRVVRTPWVQTVFLSLPVGIRRKLVHTAQQQSQSAVMEKAAEIMDVNAVAVAHTMQRAGVSILVHGHTHRPAIHDESANGAGYARIVLGDWYTQGSVLVWDDKGYRLETRRLNTDT